MQVFVQRLSFNLKFDIFYHHLKYEGFESFSDYYHFIKSCPVGYVARRKIYKNEEIITNYPVGDCSYEGLLFFFVWSLENQIVF
jgi:hypothetical protein